jgi:hypothetical protein
MPPVLWTKNRGRNGWDSPLEVGLDRSVESRNVTFYQSGLGTKRGGSTVMTESGPSGHNALIEFIPGQDQTAAQLFIVDNTATKKILRSSAGTADSPTLTNLTLKDNVASEAYNVSSAVVNGKLYLAYDSTVNRGHVYDPNNASADTVRRTGLAPFAAAASVADTGAGTYTATLRYYKTRSVEKQSTVVMRRSEGNSSVSFTPSGSGTAARITRPTAVSEDETHWEVYGSTDNVTFYGPIGTIAIATTTYDDSSTPSTWATTYDAEPTAGFHTPWPSVKSLATDGKRLLGLGVWETSAGDSVTPKNGRVYFSPVLDTSFVHDDERLSNTTTIQGFIDLARNTGAVDRGLTPRPVNNVFYAFQSLGVYGLIPTESATAPYRRVVLDTSVGAVNWQSIVVAKDKRGGACAFFLDETLGPHIVGGSDGLKWCGKDVKDVWDTFNKNATTLPAFAVWHPDRNLVLFWIATTTSNAPDTVLALDVTEMEPDEQGDLRGGWSVWTGDFAAARCGVMFSNTFANTRSRTRVPYVGLNTGTTLLRYDESATDDNGTAFQAYVTSGVVAQDTADIALQRAYLSASAQAGVAIQQALVRNFGDETDRTSDVLLTAEGSETTVLRKFEDAAVQDAWALQVTLGDAEDVASGWTIYQWRSDLTTGAPR